MTRDQYQRVRALFEEALDRNPAELSTWLVGEADTNVRQEVLSLLDYHSRAGAFLSAGVADRVPELFDERDALSAGTMIGVYKVTREVGRGGMGRVYEATDTRLGRTVALKALPPSVVGDPAQRERLRREARAAALLTHPGICTVYALEEHEGDVFIVTEYVDGHTLRAEITPGQPRRGDEIRRTARELASALAEAHAKGVVHRDLKPENVMRTADGHLKVLDFGLARVEVHGTPAVSGPVTQPGLLVGTPAYMAPEQLNGRAADARADIFAFGVLLYEFACGSHPFEAGTPLALMARVLDSDAQPIAHRCPSMPPEVAIAIERCLRKAPAERFATAGELAATLEAGLAALPAARRPATWWRTHQLTIMLLYVAATTAGWELKEYLRTSAALWLFVALGIGSAVAGIVRGHLVFTEWMNTPRIIRELRRTSSVTLVVDVLLALCLITGALLLAPREPLMAVFVITLAFGIALARLLMEPATTGAAFGDGGGVGHGASHLTQR